MAPPGLEQPELGAIITGGQSKNLKWVGNGDLEKKKMASAQGTRILIYIQNIKYFTAIDQKGHLLRRKLY